MNDKQYYVYILTNKKRGTLYIGVTNSALRRIQEHQQGLIPGFTKKYRLHKLVHIEATSDVHEALLREKRMKEWKRQWKIELIEKTNPEWRDLYADLLQE